jgi:hypothetical protein
MFAVPETRLIQNENVLSSDDPMAALEITVAAVEVVENRIAVNPPMGSANPVVLEKFTSAQLLLAPPDVANDWLKLRRFSGAYRTSPSGPISVAILARKNVADGPFLEVMAISDASREDGFENVLSAANCKSRDKPSGLDAPPFLIRLFPSPKAIKETDKRLLCQ